MRVQRLPLTLPIDEYKRLEAIAAVHDRDPWQHARWIIRQAIREESGAAEHEEQCAAVRA